MHCKQQQQQVPVMLFKATQKMWYNHVSASGIGTGASKWQMSHTQLRSCGKLEKAWQRRPKNIPGASLMQSALPDKQISKAVCISLCSKMIKCSNMQGSSRKDATNWL